MGYMKIPNLFAEQDILLFREAYALEKIHGSSASCDFNGTDLHFHAGGTDHKRFVALFDQPTLLQKFKEFFGDEKVIVYGEAYGGKMQGMSATYGKELKFIAFEVRVGDVWLAVPNAEDVAKKLGLEFVFYKKISTDLAEVDAQRDADSVQAVRNGMGAGKLREGIVLRPLIEVTKNNGKRIICKHKGDDFAEHKHNPKVVDPAKLVVMTEANEIAEQWVVANRLEHILQKLPEATGIEHTRLIIEAMVDDVYLEAGNEIIQSKEATAAISRKTAELWKKKLKNTLN